MATEEVITRHTFRCRPAEMFRTDPSRFVHAIRSEMRGARSDMDDAKTRECADIATLSTDRLASACRAYNEIN